MQEHLEEAMLGGSQFHTRLMPGAGVSLDVMLMQIWKVFLKTS
jgi:hypothetical protein